MITSFEYDPPADFDYGQVVDVTIDAADLSTPPNVMDTYEYSFTVGPAPQVNDVSPIDGDTGVSITTTISATFSEAMNQSSAVDAFSISPSVSGTFSWDGNKMIFTPSSELAYNTKYTVTISTAAKNSAGNPLADPYSWSFTTKSAPRRGGGGGTPRDTDGDGYSDIQEMLADTDENDPCDPNPDCAACLATKPAATPTAIPTIPPTVTTPTPTPTPTPTEEPGFGAVFAIAGLLAVAYLVLRRKRK